MNASAETHPVTAAPSRGALRTPVLFGLSAVTGIVDAVCYLAFGHVFTADLMERSGGNGQELRRAIEHDVRYANIAIIEGNQASQFGIGIVSARIVEAVLRDERVVIPIGSYNLTYGATLSMPSVVGRAGVLRILEPSMSEEERQALERSADRLRSVVVGFR